MKQVRIRFNTGDIAVLTILDPDSNIEKEVFKYLSSMHMAVENKILDKKYYISHEVVDGE